jgi:hypothetical protein
VPHHRTAGRFLGWSGPPGRRVARAVAVARFEARHSADIFNFFELVKQQKILQTSKNGRNLKHVQKLQSKFHMNPLEQPYTVGLAKFTFVQ